MKTPEEMAEEYTKDWWGNLPEAEGMRKSARENFLAGYKAAQDQLADADKVMCNTTMEAVKAVDTGELMPITNLPTSAKWISVKDRLPEEAEIVLTVCDNGKMFLLQKVSDEMFGVPIYWKYCCGFDKELEPNESYCYDVTHWQPLPAPPKEEK